MTYDPCKEDPCKRGRRALATFTTTWSAPAQPATFSADHLEVLSQWLCESTIAGLAQQVGELRRAGPEHWEGLLLKARSIDAHDVVYAVRQLQEAINRLDHVHHLDAALKLGGSAFGLRFRDDLEAVEGAFAAQAEAIEKARDAGLKRAGSPDDRKVLVITMTLHACSPDGVVFNTSRGSPFRSIVELVFAAAGLSGSSNALAAASKGRDLSGKRTPGGTAAAVFPRISVFDTRSL